MIKNIEDALLADRKEIVVDIGGVKRKFYANEISYLGSLNISVKAKEGKNGLALMVAESITDEDGNRMSYEQAMALKKEIAEPLWDAVIAINKVEVKEEKKS